jgi:carbamoyl-phosphate synthase large subunit
VIRALRDAPEFQGRIVGLAYDVLEPGAYVKDLVDDVYLLPYPSHGVEPLDARLRHIHDRTPLDVVIPTLDSELDGFISLAPLLTRLGIGAVLPTADQLRLRSKVALSALGRDAAIQVPETRVIADPKDLYQLPESLTFPLYVKGPYYGAIAVRDVHEAIQAWHATIAQWGAPVLIQQRASGQEYNIAAVGDGGGAVVGAVAMKKTLLTDKGKGWAGVTVRDPALLDLTARFMRATQWRGPCEIEVVKSREHGWQLLEVNPRFPAWCRLTAGAGLNLPALVARMALGEAVRPSIEYRAGTMFIRISADVITTLDDYQSLVSEGELHREQGGPA